MSKVFEHKHLVYLNETNAMGGVVYYSNYVKWQGIVREEFFIRSIPNWNEISIEAFNGNLNMITVEEHSNFIHHATFGDEIKIRATSKNIQKFNFKIAFEMYKNNQDTKIYEGWQKIAFADKLGNFVPIPEPFLKAALQHAPNEELIMYRDRYPNSKHMNLTS